VASLELVDVVKRFGATTVIQGVDLRVEDGEFVVFVGPSGCGKSTLLRMISGLEAVTEGELRSMAAASTTFRRRSAGWRWSSSPTRSIRT
jgi:ABC-type sugar transport system ATPase subunit